MAKIDPEPPNQLSSKSSDVGDAKHVASPQGATKAASPGKMREISTPQSLAKTLDSSESKVSSLHKYTDEDRYRGETKIADDKCSHTFAVPGNDHGFVPLSQLQGKPHGLGTFCFAGTGDRCEGDWEEGQLHGHGTFWFANGDRYQGDFWRGDPDGPGKYWYANGDFYEGEGNFSREASTASAMIRHGYGKYLYANKSSYDGFFVDDMRHGKGVQHHLNGEVYSGSWKEGVMHGPGIFYFASGKIEYGNYKNGEPSGHALRWSADRKRAWHLLNGKVKEQLAPDVASETAAKLHAMNQYSEPSSSIRWRERLRNEPWLRFWTPLPEGCEAPLPYPSKAPPPANGRGTYRYADGSRYQGEIHDGEPEGRGNYWYPSGNRYEGEFQARTVPCGGTFVSDQGRTYREKEPSQIGGAWVFCTQEDGLFKMVGVNQEGVQIQERHVKIEDLPALAGSKRPSQQQVWEAANRVEAGSIVQDIKFCKAGLKHGRGTLFHVDGNRYEGEFRNGFKEGLGVFWHAGGDRFVGTFKGGHRDGHGTYWYAGGEVLVSRYREGQPIGDGVWWSADRQTTARLRDGQFLEELEITVAAELAERLGFPGGAPPVTKSASKKRVVAEVDDKEEEEKTLTSALTTTNGAPSPSPSDLVATMDNGPPPPLPGPKPARPEDNDSEFVKSTLIETMDEGKGLPPATLPQDDAGGNGLAQARALDLEDTIGSQGSSVAAPLRRVMSPEEVQDFFAKGAPNKLPDGGLEAEEALLHAILGGGQQSPGMPLSFPLPVPLLGSTSGNSNDNDNGKDCDIEEDNEENNEEDNAEDNDNDKSTEKVSDSASPFKTSDSVPPLELIPQRAALGFRSQPALPPLHADAGHSAFAHLPRYAEAGGRFPLSPSRGVGLFSDTGGDAGLHAGADDRVGSYGVAGAGDGLYAGAGAGAGGASGLYSGTGVGGGLYAGGGGGLHHGMIGGGGLFAGAGGDLVPNQAADMMGAPMGLMGPSMMAPQAGQAFFTKGGPTKLPSGGAEAEEALLAMLLQGQGQAW